MPFNLGAPELIIILLVFVLLFGARKLPDLGSSMAKTIRNFKSGLNDAKQEDKPAEDVTVQADTREEAKVPPTTPPPA